MRQRILIVDDRTNILNLFRFNLEKRGYLVDTASSGREGLDRAQTSPPSMIILDLMMPDMDGLAALAQLRQLPAVRQLPILVVSARGDSASTIAAIKAGATDFLAKPVRIEELVRKVRELLAGPSCAAPAAPDPWPGVAQRVPPGEAMQGESDPTRSRRTSPRTRS